MRGLTPDHAPTPPPDAREPLIELLYDLPAITARDANSDALLDMFDFVCPDFETPPAIGPEPPKGC